MMPPRKQFLQMPFAVLATAYREAGETMHKLGHQAAREAFAKAGRTPLPEEIRRDAYIHLGTCIEAYRRAGAPDDALAELAAIGERALKSELRRLSRSASRVSGHS